MPHIPKWNPPIRFLLGWSHYVTLLTIDNSEERRFYKIEAVGNSSVQAMLFADRLDVMNSGRLAGIGVRCQRELRDDDSAIRLRDATGQSARRGPSRGASRWAARVTARPGEIQGENQGENPGPYCRRQ